MLTVGQKVYFDFWIWDTSTTSDGNLVPVPGRTLSDWTVFFRRDVDACGEVLDSVDHGDGHYTVSYTPSLPGHYYLEIYDPTYDVSNVDTEEIAPSPTVENAPVVGLDQDYGSPGALRITQPNPSSYTLYVFRTSDWIAGKRDSTYAEGSTALDNQGNWINPVKVVPDVYNLVLQKPSEVVVIQTIAVGNIAEDMQGPPGCTGPTGPTGPAGVGPTGPCGVYVGPTGSPGATGPIGMSGHVGPSPEALVVIPGKALWRYTNTDGITSRSCGTTSVREGTGNVTSAGGWWTATSQYGGQYTPILMPYVSAAGCASLNETLAYGELVTTRNIWLCSGDRRNGLYIEWMACFDTYPASPNYYIPGPADGRFCGSWIAGLWDRDIIWNDTWGYVTWPGPCNFVGFMAYNPCYLSPSGQHWDGPYNGYVFDYQSRQLQMVCRNPSNGYGIEAFAHRTNNNSKGPPIPNDSLWHQYGLRVEYDPGVGIHQFDFYYDGVGVATLPGYDLGSSFPDPTQPYFFMMAIMGDWYEPRSCRLASLYIDQVIN